MVLVEIKQYRVQNSLEEIYVKKYVP
jgi:hypothetical protein